MPRHFIIFLSLTISILKINNVIIKLNENERKRCFIIRSINAKERHNFSYVVFSEMSGGNRIKFTLYNTSENEMVYEVLPDK